MNGDTAQKQEVDDNKSCVSLFLPLKAQVHVTCNQTMLMCRFEAELRDSSGHDQREREAVAADLAAKAAAVRRRRDEMALAQEAAMQARHQLLLENRQAGMELKVLPTRRHTSSTCRVHQCYHASW